MFILNDINYYSKIGWYKTLRKQRRDQINSQNKKQNTSDQNVFHRKTINQAVKIQKMDECKDFS